MSSVTQIQPKLYRIECPFLGAGRVMVYYLATRRPALIDIGIKGSPASVIAPAIASLGREIADVRVILNTHGHFDHSGGDVEAKSISGADVLIHVNDEPFLRDREHHVATMEARGRMSGDPAHLEQARAMVRDTVAGELRADRLLEDGDEVDLGDATLDVVHAPGHTSGSACFVWREQGIAFAGDAVQVFGSESSHFPLVTDDRYRASLQKIQARSPRGLALGHRFRTRDSVLDPFVEGDAVAEALRSSDVAAAAIEAAVAEIPRKQPLEERETARLVTARLADDFGLAVDPRTAIAPSITVTLATLLERVAR